jgi:hypothetical protein
MLWRGYGEAVERRDRPSCTAHCTGCLFRVGSPDYVAQAEGRNFVLHKDPVIGKVGS